MNNYISGYECSYIQEYDQLVNQTVRKGATRLKESGREHKN